MSLQVCFTEANIVVNLSLDKECMSLEMRIESLRWDLQLVRKTDLMSHQYSLFKLGILLQLIIQPLKNKTGINCNKWRSFILKNILEEQVTITIPTILLKIIKSNLREVLVQATSKQSLLDSMKNWSIQKLVKKYNKKNISHRKI